VSWVIADALDLPFAPCSFDGVVSGFLLRNMSNILQTLGEQFRVLKTKGHMICLETSPPPRGLFRPLTHFHLHYVIPCLGRIIANNSDAYRYLSATMEDFLNANALCMKIQGAGFQHTKFSHYMLGTIAIHKGVKCP
jgi:demethylmenaquinone methyltransferase/2-methoxy-6-polyprenyl-1,4-benzoquinol methylase